MIWQRTSRRFYYEALRSHLWSADVAFWRSSLLDKKQKALTVTVNLNQLTVLCTLEEMGKGGPIPLKQIQEGVCLRTVALRSAISSMHPLVILDDSGCLSFNTKWLQRSRKRMNLAWREESVRVTYLNIMDVREETRFHEASLSELDDPYSTTLTCARRTHFDITKVRVAAMYSWDLSPTDANCPLCRMPNSEPAAHKPASEDFVVGDTVPSTNESLLSEGLCGHVFHLDCITRWMVNRTGCPYCNQTWTGAYFSATSAELVNPSRAPGLGQRLKILGRFSMFPFRSIFAADVAED